MYDVKTGWRDGREIKNPINQRAKDLLHRGDQRRRRERDPTESERVRSRESIPLGDLKIKTSTEERVCGPGQRKTS